MVDVKTLSDFRQHSRASCHACDMFFFFLDQRAHLTGDLAIFTMALYGMTGGCDLLISEMKVCFLECHNSIIPKIFSVVKSFFLLSVGCAQDSILSPRMP